MENYSTGRGLEEMAADAGASMTQMGIDTLLNTAMGTQGSKLPLAFRAFGGATQQARADGADLKGQVLYGGAVAAKEVITEMLGNIAMPFAKAYGSGAIDDVVQNSITKAVEKLGKTAAGKRALNALLQVGASGVSEGLEELIGDWMEWQMPRIYGGEVSSVSEVLANSLYDFAVGGLSGVAGAAVSPSTYRLQMPTLTTYEQRAAEYRGEKPQNVSDPRIGRLEISSEKYNPEGADISTIYGNRYRQQVKEDAIRRLGIADGKPAYLVASNITKNGREYYVDVTKASLNKMLYTRDHEMLPLERILLVENLEKAIDNSYWAESNGDRKSRPQIDGFDTLRTSFYIDGIPYYADIKVKVIQGKNSTDPQNVVYFLEPEEITAIKKVDAPSPTGALLERNIVFRDGTSTVDTTVPQKESGVNAQDTQDNGNYAERPAAPLRMPQLTTYEQREKTTTEAQKVSRMNNENGLAAYTQQERINLSSGIKNKIISTYQETVNFVKNALVNKNNADRAYMGIVPENVANQVKKETGVDISGYGVMMNGVDIRHIIKEHGNPVTEPERGQVAVTAEDIARVPEVIAHPDKVYLSDKTDAKGRKAIVFEKQFGDTYITIQGVSNGKKLLQTNTLYKRKGKARTTRYTMIDAQESAAPVINVQNGPPQSLSYETSVPQEKETVNRLKMPQLVDEQGRTYEQRMAAEQVQQAARDAQEDAEAISRATAMMDRDFAEAAERANEQRTQQEAQGKEMPEHGKKVYETLFYPVTENNGRQIDWVNFMLDKVRTFTDSKGNDRELNRKERELVQKIVEYRASEKRVQDLQKQYETARQNVDNAEKEKRNQKE